jgi:type I restriction enzyme S subunit
MGKEWTLAENDAQGEWTLPDGWAWTTIGEACEVILGQSPPSSTYNKDGIGLPFYQGKAEFGDVYPTPVKWCSKPKKIAEAGDILISVRAPVGPTNLCREKSCIGRGLSAIRPKLGMSNLYFLYFLQGIEQDWQSKATGTTFSAISGKVLRAQEVPLAPLPEQHRIVTEIETQFTRLDAAVAALERAQANLRRYKAAVLKAACEGHLVPTEAELARAEGRDYEPADQLLARILSERRARWEAEHPGKRYMEPAPQDAEDLPRLPEGWYWTNMMSITADGPQNGLYLPQDLYGQGPPILRIDDYQDGWSRPASELRLVGANEEQIKKYGLAVGDLVINRVNSPSHLGKCLVVLARNVPSLFESNMMRLRLSESVSTHFVEFYLRSPFGRMQLTKNAKWAVNQASINQKDVGNTPVALPPLAEQHHIVAEVERQLSMVAALEREVEAALARAGRLRQAVLKQAFEGRLVPQDPNDEPASVLLERIRAEKTQRETERKPKGRGSGKKRRGAEKVQQLELF